METAQWQLVENELVGEKRQRQWIPMRDGIRLDANIYFPRQKQPTYPSLLIRSPYPEQPILNRYAELYGHFLREGYVLIYQYERGRYWSEGDSCFLARAAEDGFDTIDWIAKQSWSNGKVGTIGCSSSAENQLLLASQPHPAHAAAIAQAPGSGIGKIGAYCEQGNIYRGGALQLMFASWFNDYMVYGKRGARQRPQFPSDLNREERIRLSTLFSLEANTGWDDSRQDFDYKSYFKHLPACEINRAIDGGLTDWDDFARRMPADPAWQQTSFANEGDYIRVPMLWVCSWYDIAVAPNIALFNDSRANSPLGDHQYLLVSPMSHCQFGKESENTLLGERALGDARYDYTKRYLEWFDYWLKGQDNKALAQARVCYYQMGLNQWRHENSFPPTDRRPQPFYLHSTGAANSRYGEGRLCGKAPIGDQPADQFIYDPQHPVPTLGGGACCMGDIPSEGSWDQSDLEIRSDILVYTSEPFAKALDMAGFIQIELFVASSAKDTDFTVKLLDVYPDGRAYNLDDSIFRARYREGYDKTVLMQPDSVYRIVFPPLASANTFLQGHRLRLEISSSNFPRYDRNLNTGGNNFDETESTVATNKIYHCQQYPSCIRLPIKQQDTL